MVKVCHITSAHQPEDERIFHKECVSLAKAGYEVYLVQQGDSYEKDGVHIIGFGIPASNRLKRMLFTTRRAYQTALALDADIYHFHDPELLPYGPKLKKRGKKVIFDSHEDVSGSIQQKEWIPRPLRGIVTRLYIWLEKTICHQLDAVVSATPHVVAHFQPLLSRSILVTNYPIIRSNMKPPTFQAKTIVFAGGISQQWNHHTILKALEQLPDCQYHLYGFGEDAYLQELQVLPAWKQVQYFGHVPHKKVLSLLPENYVAIALLSYIPNSDWKTGTMGNTKIFEEMMAGLPVVCTDFRLWREFVDRWQCGICVNPESPDEIAAAIRYLLDNPEKARQMGENGCKAVKEEFNWDMAKKNLFHLYNDLAISSGT